MDTIPWVCNKAWMQCIVYLMYIFHNTNPISVLTAPEHAAAGCSQSVLYNRTLISCFLGTYSLVSIFTSSPKNGDGGAGLCVWDIFMPAAHQLDLLNK